MEREMGSSQEYVDISVLGSVYEEQMEIRSSRVRHRRRHSQYQEAWKAGPAPINITCIEDDIEMPPQQTF